MKTVDFAYVILTYNFLIGSLLIIAGENLGMMAASVLRVKKQSVARLTRVACATFGMCLVTISLAALVTSLSAS